MRRTLTTIVALTLAVAAWAQAVPFVTIPHPTASLALGGAHAATPEAAPMKETAFEAGVDKLFWQTSAINYNITNYAVRARVIEALTLGFEYTTNSMEEVTLYSGTGQALGTTQPNEMSAALSASFAPTKNIFILARGKYIHSSLTDTDDAKGWAADLGAVWQISKPLAVGLLAENFGTGIDYGYGEYPLPSTVKAGVYGNFALAPRHAIETAADAGLMPFYSAFLASIGAGYVYNRMLALRVGAHISTKGDILPTYASVGLFFTSTNFDIGAAYLTASNTYSISARLKL